LNFAEQSGRRFLPHMDGGRVGFAIPHISNPVMKKPNKGEGFLTLA
jgi:hypothetical protein